MVMKQKILFRVFIVLMFTVLVLFITSTVKAEVSYDTEVAGAMITEIEQCRVMQSEMQIMQGMVDSLNTQLTLIEEKTNLLQTRLDNNQKECDKRVKEATPTLTDKVKTATTWGVVGAIIVTVIRLLL